MIEFNDQQFLTGLHTGSEISAHELEQFRFFQSHPFDRYRSARLSFLAKEDKRGDHARIFDSFIPRIAVFAGSFSPFHKGHYNVLQKAESIFDKVIIAFGRNPEKQNQGYRVPQTIKNRQIESYDGLLTDFVSSLPHEVVVIRGLRNSTDFQYEQNQYRYIQELMPQIRIVSIFCDKEFEHISSSGIRTLEKFGKHLGYLLD